MLALLVWVMFLLLLDRLVLFNDQLHHHLIAVNNNYFSTCNLRSNHPNSNLHNCNNSSNSPLLSTLRCNNSSCSQYHLTPCWYHLTIDKTPTSKIPTCRRYLPLLIPSHRSISLNSAPRLSTLHSHPSPNPSIRDKECLPICQTRLVGQVVCPANRLLNRRWTGVVLRCHGYSQRVKRLVQKKQRIIYSIVWRRLCRRNSKVRNLPRRI